MLGLDVEVAAQPWRDPAVARADLDAFADAAAAFADDEEEPTLGAFLAYLTAAEAEEFGLETGQPSGADSVTLATVHAAKGLQWAAVVVPGLAGRARGPGLPARPRVTTRWTENPRLLPFGLRGDADRPAGAAGPGRRLAGRLHRGVRGPRAGRGAAARVRGGDPGGVLARLLRLLVGRGRVAGWGRRRSWRRCGPPARPARAPVAPGRRRPRRRARTPPSPSLAPRPGPPPGRPRLCGRAGSSRVVSAAMKPGRGAPDRDRSGDDDGHAHPGRPRPGRRPGARDAGLLLTERERRRAEGGLRVTLPGQPVGLGAGDAGP